MAGLTKEQRAAKAAGLATIAAAGRLEERPADGCVFMYRENDRAEVAMNSIEIMAAQGWEQRR